MKYQIRYGAIGGQGIVTAANLLCEIAVKLENKHAVSSPTYTAAVRGGATKADVIISDEPVLFTHSTAIDFFICTDQRPYGLYKNNIKKGAILVVDSNLVTDMGDVSDWTVYPIPLIVDTERETGSIMLTSVVSLAITQYLTKIIDYENMTSFVKEWAPKQYLDANIKALRLGATLIENCVPIGKKQ